MMAGDTKERILKIALELFAEKGYLGTSMSDIANRLGIVFISLITRIKSGNKPDVIGKPVKKQDQIKDNGKKKQKKE